MAKNSQFCIAEIIYVEGWYDQTQLTTLQHTCELKMRMLALVKICCGGPPWPASPPFNLQNSWLIENENPRAKEKVKQVCTGTKNS